MVPDIAMAASAREWPDRFHRFLLDHGGGRVVERIMSVEDATNQDFDVLLIDDVCSFLTPRLVAVLKQSGREVIGVYMPEDGSDAKRRLLECGISDVIESEATAEEFRAKVDATLAHRLTTPSSDPIPMSSALRIAVTGPCSGVGITEVSIALASLLARQRQAALVDMDSNWPSVAQRLDLPLHPNIRTALDHALHRLDRLEDAGHWVDRLWVVGGRADGGVGAEISRSEHSMLLDVLGVRHDLVVVDLGPLDEVNGGLLREFDAVIMVGASSPVGIARLIRTADVVLTRNPETSLLVVANGVASGGYKRSEVIGEVQRALPSAAVATLPYEPRLAQAAWDGAIVRKGRFNRAVEEMVSVVLRSLP